MINRPLPALRSLALIAAPVLLLSACGEQEEAESDVAIDTSDPLMTGALADQILVDPDMVNRNTGNMAASIASRDGSIPFPDQGAEAIMAARTEAVELVGGNSAMRTAPPATRVDGKLPPDAALSVAARAASAGEGNGNGSGNGDCAAQAEFSAIWAARMPQSFPVYPRGAVHEAAGTDAAPCALRVVNFTTPVDAGDVMDFYYTRAIAAGFSAQRVIQDGDDILGGTRGSGSYMVFVRPHPGGGTDVDLVTNGR